MTGELATLVRCVSLKDDLAFGIAARRRLVLNLDVAVRGWIGLHATGVVWHSEGPDMIIGAMRIEPTPAGVDLGPQSVPGKVPNWIAEFRHLAPMAPHPGGFGIWTVEGPAERRLRALFEPQGRTEARPATHPKA